VDGWQRAGDKVKTVPFDDMAVGYDASFTETKLGRHLRGIVWERLKKNFSAGHFVLELNCGTGEDAVWLAKQGCRVVATDVSLEMLAAASRKANFFGLADQIDVRLLDIGSPVLDFPNERFEGAFSNFGGLNCVEDLEPVSRYLGAKVKKGGRIVLVIMGRWCLWEIVWHLLHGEVQTAFRRFNPDGMDVKLNNSTIHVWYPALREIHRKFCRFFVVRRITGLGLFLPPTYLEGVVSNRPFLWKLLAGLEWIFSGLYPFKYFADHLILEYERL
jgi:SAM-dependent methyltransferase